MIPKAIENLLSKMFECQELFEYHYKKVLKSFFNE